MNRVDALYRGDGSLLITHHLPGIDQLTTPNTSPQPSSLYQDVFSRQIFRICFGIGLCEKEEEETSEVPEEAMFLHRHPRRPTDFFCCENPNLVFSSETKKKRVSAEAECRLYDPVRGKFFRSSNHHDDTPRPFLITLYRNPLPHSHIYRNSHVSLIRRCPGTFHLLFHLQTRRFASVLNGPTKCVDPIRLVKFQFDPCIFAGYGETLIESSSSSSSSSGETLALLLNERRRSIGDRAVRMRLSLSSTQSDHDLPVGIYDLVTRQFCSWLASETEKLEDHDLLLSFKLNFRPSPFRHLLLFRACETNRHFTTSHPDIVVRIPRGSIPHLIFQPQHWVTEQGCVESQRLTTQGWDPFRGRSNGTIGTNMVFRVARSKKEGSLFSVWDDNLEYLPHSLDSPRPNLKTSQRRIYCLTSKNFAEQSLIFVNMLSEELCTIAFYDGQPQVIIFSASSLPHPLPFRFHQPCLLVVPHQGAWHVHGAPFILRRDRFPLIPTIDQ